MNREFNNKLIPSGVYGRYPVRPTGLMNQYNQAYDSNRDLIAIMMTEQYNHAGVKSEFYITTFDTSYDERFGDDDDRRIIRKFELMVWFQLPKEDKTWSMFGIEGLDNFTMYCSKLHFDEASTCDATGNPQTHEMHVPQIGDIIKVAFNNFIYEIVDVKEEDLMSYQSKRYAWSFTVKPFVNEKQGVEDLPEDDEVRRAVEANDIFDVADVVRVASSKINYEPSSQGDVEQDPFGYWDDEN